MKVTGLFVIGLLPFIATAKPLLVTVENPSSFSRSAEVITLSIDALRAKMGESSASSFRVTEKGSATALPAQVTNDGLLFQSDFKPMEKKYFVVASVQRDTIKFPSLVDGRFELPREDYAWENDRIAFRMYGPALAKEVNNGIDVWTKRTRSLVVDKWYRASATAGKDTYHEDHGEGADFFSVGRSLGAGGCGVWRNGVLLQPGVFTSQKTICNGPLRVMFELTYAHWIIAGRSITQRMRVMLDAGSDLNRIEVSFDGLDNSDTILVACGLVKRPNTTLVVNRDEGVMSLWGLTNADSVNGYLGTGVLVDPSLFIRICEDQDNYLLISRYSTSDPFVYYAGAGWTRSGDFSSAEDWTSYLDASAGRLRKPLLVAMRPI